VTKPFVFQSPVRFTHTDPAGFVFFPRFFEKFQAAVEDWFTHGLGVNYARLVIEDNIGFPTANTECTFKKPCRLGEILELTVLLRKLGNTSISVEFVGTVKGEERLRARSVLVAIDLDDGRPKPMNDNLRAKLEAYEKLTANLP